MDRRIIFVAVALLSGMLVSCEREPQWDSKSGQRGISVDVTEISNNMTKSSEQEHIASYVMDGADGDDLKLDVFVSENQSLPFEVADTKAGIVTTSSMNTSGKSFVMNAWLGSDNREETNYRFIENRSVSYDGSSWSLLDNDNKEYMWRNNVPTVFWSIYPAVASSGDSRTVTWPGSTASDADQKHIYFDYTNQAASSQKDLLFAYNYQYAKFGDTAGEAGYGELVGGSTTVNVSFSHALAAIRFDISGLIAKGMNIQSITFKNLLKYGSCYVEGVDSSNKVSYTWSSNMTATVDCSLNLASTDFTTTGLDGTTANALMPLASDKFLFLMPQEIKGKNVVLEITLKEGATDTTITKSIVLDHEEDWEPGMIYTYKLSYSDVVDVLVEDTCVENVKSNVKIKNTGNVREFIRVAIVGFWGKDDESDGSLVINAPWTFDYSDIAFEGWNTTDWTYNSSDGFFYSNAAVDPDAAKTLFTKYTAPAGPDGDKLYIDIIAQAVAAGTATSWAGATGN